MAAATRSEMNEGDDIQDDEAFAVQRTSSTGSVSSFEEDKITMFDLISTFVPTVNKVKNRSGKLKEHVIRQRDRVLSKQEKELQKYKQKVATSFDKLMCKWEEKGTVSLREKVAFMSGVVNIFCSALIIGGHPRFLHIWYTVQLAYFMPLRFFT